MLCSSCIITMMERNWIVSDHLWNNELQRQFLTVLKEKRFIIQLDISSTDFKTFNIFEFTKLFMIRELLFFSTFSVGDPKNIHELLHLRRVLSKIHCQRQSEDNLRNFELYLFLHSSLLNFFIKYSVHSIHKIIKNKKFASYLEFKSLHFLIKVDISQIFQISNIYRSENQTLHSNSF